MSAVVTFFVPGVPAPGGSKKSFVSKSTGKIVTLDDAKNNGGWRDRVAAFARTAYHGDPLREPVETRFTFVVPRPKGHFGTGRNAGKVKPSAPAYPTVRPDALKLARAAEDALTGILYADDSVSVDLPIAKRYGDAPGVWVSVHRMPAVEPGKADVNRREASWQSSECVDFGGPRKCCDRAGEYNGFGSDGPLAFRCEHSCACHD